MRITNLKVFRNINPLTPLSGILSLMLLANPISADVIADYDKEWKLNASEKRLENSTTGVWTTLDTGHAVQSISLDSSKSPEGAAAKIDVTGYGSDGLFKIYFAYNEDRYTTLKAPDGNNRMILYVTIPYAGDGNEHTFHIGTYSKNPATANTTSNVGNHWYHYYELRGSTKNYWTKMYMDKHPQHEVSEKTPPKNNPSAEDGFDYFDGLTRLYLQMKYSPFKSNWPGPYTMHVDEIEFYKEDRPENTHSINSVAITYHGYGQFDLDWSSFSLYDRHNETFEIKYSGSPINTTDDYDKAMLVPGSPSGGWGQDNIGHHDNHYRAKFQIQDMDESKTIYFAIKDLYPDHPKALKRVDYLVNGVAAADSPPKSQSMTQ